MLKISSKKYKALLFDMDGTLVDSESTHYKAVSKVFDKYNKKYVSFDTHKKLYTGTGIYNVAKKEIKRHNLDENPEDIIREFHQTVGEIIENEGLIPMKGIINFLKLCQEKSFKLAVVSGSTSDLVEHSLKKAGIPNIFEEVVGADKFGIPKPDPACYLLAAKLLGVSPKDCLAFEDAPNGLLSAKNAGIDVIAIGETLSPEQINSIDPNIVHLKDFTEIEII